MAPPSLAVVLCGDDPASAIYVRNKGRAAERAGIQFTLHRPPGESTTDELVELVRSLDADDTVDGILVQLPLPSQVDPDAVMARISPRRTPTDSTRTTSGASPKAIPPSSHPERHSVSWNCSAATTRRCAAAGRS